MSIVELLHDRSPFRWSGPVPGDKSLSHRALLFAALSTQRRPSRVRGLGPGADVASTRSVLARLGVRFDGDDVYGSELRPVDHPLDCGNSGTTLRLLAGAMAAVSSPTELVGDESLNRRPMRRLV